MNKVIHLIVYGKGFTKRRGILSRIYLHIFVLSRRDAILCPDFPDALLKWMCLYISWTFQTKNMTTRCSWKNYRLHRIVNYTARQLRIKEFISPREDFDHTCKTEWGAPPFSDRFSVPLHGLSGRADLNEGFFHSSSLETFAQSNIARCHLSRQFWA